MGRPRKNPEQGLANRMTLKHGSFYYIHAPDENGKQRWENLGKNLVAATEIANVYNGNQSTRGTMGYWLDEWVKFLKLRVARGNLAKRSLSDYEGMLPYLKAYFGSMIPRAIESEHVRDYLDMGLEEDRAVRANRERATLSACISWMVERKHAGLKGNVCLQVARNPEKPRERYISDSEYNQVLDVAGAPVRALMECMQRTLQRPSDILRWTKHNIIEEKGQRMLTFKQSKTGAMMKIVIGPKLQAAFDEMAAARAAQKRKVDSLFLICTRHGQPYTQMGISSMMRRHISDQAIEDFMPYDCKAKGATDMFTDGVSLETISALCGHDSIATTERYVKRRLVVPVESNERELERPQKAV